MTQQELNEILKLHKLWLSCKEGGKCANLRGANLAGADFERANLAGANFERSNLEDANFEGAKLVGANFDGANCEGANFEGAKLVGANFVRANLVEANFVGANVQNVKADVHFYTVGGIGREGRQTLYIPELDVVFCGCFKGTMAEFESQIKETYPYGNEQYQAAVAYLKSLPKFEPQC